MNDHLTYNAAVNYLTANFPHDTQRDATLHLERAVCSGAVRARAGGHEIGKDEWAMGPHHGLIPPVPPPYEIEIHRRDVERLCSPKGKGGRSRNPDWDDFFTEIIRYAHTNIDGLPRKQSDLIRHMLEWTTKHWGEDAEGSSESNIEAKVSKIYRVLPKT